MLEKRMSEEIHYEDSSYPGMYFSQALLLLMQAGHATHGMLKLIIMPTTFFLLKDFFFSQ